MLVRSIQLLFICLFGFFSAKSQSFTHFTKEDGLPSELVKSVVEDDKGFTWLATDEGLIRFDGKNFEHYQNLPSSYVKHLFKRKNGQILATTDMGLVEIKNFENPSFEILLEGKSEASENFLCYPKFIYEDQNQNLWIADNHHLVRLKNKKFKHYPFPAKNKTGHFQRSFSFFEVQKELFAFSNTGFLYRYVPSQDVFIEVSLPNVVPDIFHAISLPNTNKVLFSSSEGVFELAFDQSAGLISQKLLQADLNISYFAATDSVIYAGSWTKGLFKILSDYQFVPQNIPLNNISGISIHKNSLSLASDNGLLMIYKKTFSPYFQDISRIYIQSITKDAQKVYFTDGENVVSVDANYKPEILYKNKIGLLLTINKRKEDFIFTDNGGKIIVFKHQKASLLKDLSANGKAIFSAFLDQNQNLWLCQDQNSQLICLTADNQLKFYGKEKGLTARPMVVRQSPNGKIYCGANQDDGFLFVYNPQKDSFENLSQKVVFKHNEALLINDIAFKKDQILLGTSFGLLTYQKNTFERKDLGDITHEGVKSVFIDKNEDVWLAGSRGLIKLLKGENLLFDERHGLVSKGIVYRGLLADKNQKIWVGTFNGVSILQDTARFYKTPTPKIIRISVEKENNNYQINIHDFLQVEYVANVIPQKQVSYQVNWKGKWEDMGNKTNLLLSDLEVKEYKLQIRAKQSGNYVWSDAVILSFEVTQVWYQRWWGILVIILLVSGLILVLIWFNTWNHKREQKRLETIIWERTHQLQEVNDQLSEKNKEIFEKSHILQENIADSEKKNQEILLQNEVLEQQKEELQAILEDLKKTQMQLIHSEKMNSLGRLTAGISHEINNPLNYISAGIQALETIFGEVQELVDEYSILDEALPEHEHIKKIKKLKKDIDFEYIFPDLKAMVESIKDGSARIQNIIQELRNFSRLDEDVPKMVDLHAGIDSTLFLLKNRLHDNIEIQKEYATDVPKIEVLPGQINQLFMCLLENAIESLKGKGKIFIQVKKIIPELNDYQKKQNVLGLPLVPHIRISIKDTGKGIPKEIHDKIFDPFFTTKDIGEGRGVGLSISDSIVKNHNGIIEFETQEGVGTEFIILLPIKE